MGGSYRLMLLQCVQQRSILLRVHVDHVGTRLLKLYVRHRSGRYRALLDKQVFVGHRVGDVFQFLSCHCLHTRNSLLDVRLDIR